MKMQSEVCDRQVIVPGFFFLALCLPLPSPPCLSFVMTVGNCQLQQHRSQVDITFTNVGTSICRYNTSSGQLGPPKLSQTLQALQRLPLPKGPSSFILMRIEPVPLPLEHVL